MGTCVRFILLRTCQKRTVLGPARTINITISTRCVSVDLFMLLCEFNYATNVKTYFFAVKKKTNLNNILYHFLEAMFL